MVPHKRKNMLGLLVLGLLGVSAVVAALSYTTRASASTPNEAKVQREQAAQKRSNNGAQAGGAKPTFPRLEAQPDWAKRIAEIPQRGYVSHPILRGSSSVWQVDSVPNADFTDWNPLFVYAKLGQDGHPLLGMMVMNMPQDQTWSGQWIAP